MLCDQFAEFEKSAFFAQLPSVLKLATSELGRKIATAPRYTLDRGAVMMVQNLSNMEPHKFISALPLCRLPHKSIWVEFAFRDRSDWLDEARKQGKTIQQRADADAPPRLGFYLEALDDAGQDISVQLVWAHIPPMVSPSMKALRLRTGADYVATESRRSEILDLLKSKVIQAKAPWLANPQAFEAAVELESRIETIIPEYLAPIWLSFADNKDTIRKMDEMAEFDLAAEWRFAMALLAALNSRNLFAYGDEVNYGKLNDIRARKGRTPLLPHREIRLSLSRAQSSRVNSHGVVGTRSIPSAALLMVPRITGSHHRRVNPWFARHV